jgi:hypothetical protein
MKGSIDDARSGENLRIVRSLQLRKEALCAPGKFLFVFALPSAGREPASALRRLGWLPPLGGHTKNLVERTVERGFLHRFRDAASNFRSLRECDLQAVWIDVWEHARQLK